MADKIERDEISGTVTTGHEWDGIRELDTPLPKWWLSIFYATIVWAIAYTIAFPAWPLISSYTKGVLGSSTRGDVMQALVDHEEMRSGWRDRIAAASLADIRADEELFDFAFASGRSAFAVNCSPCHGSGAQGAPGYPNLNDDAWIWGGTIEDIHYTIVHGARNGSPDARFTEMPGFGEMGILDDDQITATAEYVLSLSGLDHDATLAEAGATVFAENCAACHGENGEGSHELGAPKLADQVWLYAGSRDEIVTQITTPRHGVMPAWGERLDETTIKELSVYVHALGGGQ